MIRILIINALFCSPYYFKGITKNSYVPFKRPKEMNAADYDQLLPKNNWTPEVKKRTSSILVGCDDPPVTLVHSAVGVVHSLKIYGQYGQLTKRYEMGCKVINYGLTLNRLVVAHKKLGGQRLCLLNHEMLQSWVESLCENFSSNDIEPYYQGDGNAPVEISRDGASGGVPVHAFMDGTITNANQLSNFTCTTLRRRSRQGYILHQMITELKRCNITIC